MSGPSVCLLLALLAALCVLTALIRGEEQRLRHVGRATEGDTTA